MTTDSESNLWLWNQVCKTDSTKTKKYTKGYSATAICPHYQRETATNIFGPFGDGWGVVPDSVKFEFIPAGGSSLCLYTATLFWNHPETGTRHELPLAASINVSYPVNAGKTNEYVKVDDEFAKKVATMAVSKGLSLLGFNADVFLGKFEDMGYKAELIAEEELASVISSEQVSEIRTLCEEQDKAGGATVGTMEARVASAYKIDSIDLLPSSWFVAARKRLLDRNAQIAGVE